MTATPTGLEPATSAVTGRRANQLRYGALSDLRLGSGTPNRVRTGVTGVKGQRPRPLDDGGTWIAPLRSLWELIKHKGRAPSKTNERPVRSLTESFTYAP